MLLTFYIKIDIISLVKLEGNKMNKKNRGIVGIIIIVILVIVIAILATVILLAYRFVNKRLEKINFVQIDKNDLDIVDIYVDDENITKQKYDTIKTIALLGTDSRDVNNMYSRKS